MREQADKPIIFRCNASDIWDGSEIWTVPAVNEQNYWLYSLHARRSLHVHAICGRQHL